MIEDETARSLRAHIRVSCRAVAALEESSPIDLIEALIKIVRVGAVKHDEKGRVGAFAARFETDLYRGPRDRPIAVDLAAALSALAGDQRENLLAAILDIDEPIVLARLIGLAPRDARTRIESRIDALTPSDAGGIRSLPEAMIRIEELLNAGRADAAAKFIEAERGLRPLGPVAGRDLAQLRTDLRLKLLRQDWSGVAATAPPAGLVGQARDSALDVINFFKGLACPERSQREPRRRGEFLRRPASPAPARRCLCGQSVRGPDQRFAWNGWVRGAPGAEAGFAAGRFWLKPSKPCFTCATRVKRIWRL
jgi:hypothetical protein